MALEAALEVVRLDETAERAYQLLMLAYGALSNRAEAIRCYHRLRMLLQEELGVSPAPETEALYLELLG